MLECRADLLSMACPTLQAFHSLDLKKGPQKLLAKAIPCLHETMPKRRALYLQEGGEQCRVLGLRAGAQPAGVIAGRALHGVHRAAGGAV